MSNRKIKSLTVAEVEAALVKAANFEADYIRRLGFTWDRVRACGNAIDALKYAADQLALEGLKEKLQAIDNGIREAWDSSRCRELDLIPAAAGSSAKK